jgi:hypothetical protein
MRTFATKSIREMLRAAPDGLDVGTIANALNREPSNIRSRLREMPDAYIDRWVREYGNPPMAIWCVVVPPESCPRPDARPRRKDNGRNT